MAKTGSVINLVFGIAIILLMGMAVLRGEASAQGIYLLVPMGLGLYFLISGIVGLLKKEPQTSQPQPLQPVVPSQPAQQAQITPAQTPQTLAVQPAK